MARKCEITGKSALSGNKRSHALNATRRKWNVNLQKVSIVVDGEVKTLRVATRTLKTLKRKGQIAQ
ncbi:MULTISPECIES: 50S ribosomal protein L28 [Spiroplasma]|uniref:Large ribosomal subunit protein bL28 n=1 Tax=Spiroplasma phoeniceum P40 TaxID=1276259 RepID=A0A345DRC9_9MOLU|nr:MULTISPECIES: 50S ribosomal protein L28 [Spiroplasma]AXF96770.1 50S ribosomal protein L28 [Spiroplasma phoeniceum P40]RUO86874.1 50S ribosomal protein L28 [Spiroplasma endosymbiont of Megaselia nigra]UZQ31015.1 MAG: 50S ribosomal protein L28 [Spiroplasma phoeniceum]UZQ33443.1 MAG: 50S ribosomal protein L28 [Spiroplasma phoeniceum]